jgi:DNA-binding MarR family transcriptional regulator
MTMAQLKVLYLLWARREVRMSELVAMLGVSTSTISELVDRLVEGGQAGRRDDPVDRRQVLVGITPAGVETLDRFRELNQRQMRELLEAIDAADLATVRTAIELLTAAASRKGRS